MSPAHICIAGLLSALIAVFFAPMVFGVVGVAAGTVAVARGSHRSGSAVVTLSAVGGVLGYYLALLA